MKRLSLISAACVALLVVSLSAKEIDLEKIKCVMNPKAAAKVDKTLEYKGGHVYFCCGNCPKGFTAKLEAGDKTVAAKGNRQLIQTGQAKQAKCPFTGGPMKVKLTIADAEIQVCCNKCKAKAEGLEGDKQLVALYGDDAFKKAGFKVGEKEKAAATN